MVASGVRSPLFLSSPLVKVSFGPTLPQPDQFPTPFLLPLAWPANLELWSLSFSSPKNLGRLGRTHDKERKEGKEIEQKRRWALAAVATLPLYPLLAFRGPQLPAPKFP